MKDVTDFSHVFDAAENPVFETFNQPLTNWNTGKATTYVSWESLLDGNVAPI